MANEIGCKSLAVREHGREVPYELPDLTGESSLSAPLNQSGDPEPAKDYGFSCAGQLDVRGVSNRAGLRELASDALDPFAERF